MTGESEKQFQEKVVQLARLLGYRCYHTHDSRRSAAGFPDLVLAKPGRLVFAELKSEKGKVSREQEQWIETLRAAGAHVCLWRAGDMPTVVRVLQGHDEAA